MKTNRTKTEIATKVAKIIEPYYGNSGEAEVVAAEMAASVMNADDASDARNLLYDDWSWPMSAIDELLGWLTKGEAVRKVVRSIESWTELEDGEHAVSVRYRDDSYWSGVVTRERWDQMKDEEQQADLDEANAPAFTKVERNPYEDLNDDELDALVDPRAEEIAAYAMQTEHFGLCSWCKSYYDSETGETVCKLTDEEYEPTTHPESGASHGICPQCKSAMMKERR